MSLTTRIEQDYIAAYKAKDALRLGVLRLLKTAAKNLQVELMRHVTDEELATVVQKQAKQRQDSIEQFTAANRPDLAEKEAAELSILKDYLPEPLSEEELAAAIDAAIAKLESGELKVFDCATFTVEGKTLDSCMADVDTDADYTPDTEVIENGAFMESKFRSAPYFQLNIDGITLLDQKF